VSEDLTKLVGEAAHGILGRTTPTADPWAAVREGGWAGIGVPEERGGQGGTLAEAAAVARAVGATAYGGPVLESMIGGLMLGACPSARGLLDDVVAGRQRATLIPRVVRSDFSGCVIDRMVAPWARDATVIVLIVSLDEGGLGLVALPATEVSLVEGTTLAGDALDEVRVAGNQLPAVVRELEMPLEQLVAAGGLLTAARIVGALRATADLSVEYAQQRRQFGKPIGAFQAIAHDLVRQAGHVALAEAALDAGTRGALSGDATACEAARVVASNATVPVSRIAHQVHGAVGTTQEHDLHRYTLRLASWRDAFSTTRWWTRRVGARAIASDAWWTATDPAAPGTAADAA